MNYRHHNRLFKSLGDFDGTDYKPKDSCVSALEEILSGILHENKNLREYRTTVGVMQNVQNDLIPILTHAKDNKILDLTIEILLHLTTPIECLIFLNELSKTKAEQQTFETLKKFLTSYKGLFANVEVIKTIKNVINRTINNAKEISIINVNNCLMLLRNILNIPEDESTSGKINTTIIWNIMSTGINKILLRLLRAPQKVSWGIAVAEFIASIYREEKSIDAWLKQTLAENNDNNTFPFEQELGRVLLLLNEEENNSKPEGETLIPEELDAPTYNSDDLHKMLKMFLVDFLVNDFDSIVQSLYFELICNLKLRTCTPSLYELLAFFLKFAIHSGLHFKFLKNIMSYKTISYLVYEGVKLYEQTQLAIRRNRSDARININNLQLVITSIREFLQMVEVYKKAFYLDFEERVQIIDLQIQMNNSNDLRHLVILLFRNYIPNMHSKVYLKDMIVTNHILLSFLEISPILLDQGDSHFLEHLKQLSTAKIMQNYALVLENFKTNEIYINDCIFTVMRHIGKYLNRTEVFSQPNILRICHVIKKTNFENCEKWFKFINQVIGAKGPSTVVVPKPLPKLPSLEASKSFIDSIQLDTSNRDMMEIMKSNLNKEDMSQAFQWLKRILFDAYFSKICVDDTMFIEKVDRVLPTAEPISFYNALLKQPIPIVAWTDEQTEALLHGEFLIFMQCLGLYLPSISGKMFVQIPNFWTANHILEVASLL